MVTVDRIFELIKENKVTAKEVANATGLSPSNFTEWKKGNNKPGYGAVVKIAEYFGVSTDYLLGDTDIRRHTESVAASSKVPYQDLPPEAIAELEQYKEFLRQKYGKK